MDSNDIMEQMFDELTNRINEVNQVSGCGFGALVILLTEKGIITKEEFNRAYIQAQHTISQELARKRDEG